MKQLFFTLFFFLFFTGFLNAQATYYYVGGAGPVNISLNSNWSTVQNNSDAGNLRAVAAAATDVLIFDGNNIGGNTVTTGPATLVVNSTTPCGQIKLQNNMSLILKRLTGTTGTINISGDGTAADDFLIPAGSSLTMNSTTAEGVVVVNLGSAKLLNVTGRIGGALTITNTGGHRLGSFTTDGLVFEAGSTFFSDNTPASSAYLFGSGTTASQGALNSVAFLSGASIIHTGKYSPLGSSAGQQVIDMMPGSNFYCRTTNAASTGSYVSGKYLSNFYVQNNSTFTADGSVYKFDKLIVEAGSTYITHTSGSTPVTDTLRVEGTLTMPTVSTNALILAGTISRDLPSPSGAGTINVPQIIASEFTPVTLRNNVNVTSSCIVMDSFNFKTFQLTGTTGTPTFTARGIQAPITSYTATVTAGSYMLTVSSAPSSLNGLTVTGAGIQPGTVVLAFLSGGSVYLSKPATLTGTTVPLSFFTSSPATLRTANANGFDDATGSITVPGAKGYNSGINYIFDGATTKPFSTSGTFSGTVNNLTINAPITTNRNSRVNGVLTMNNGNINIRSTDSLYISSSGSLTGADATKYLVIEKDAAGTGVFTKNGFTAPTLFPVGTAARYMPVTLAPQTNPADFSVSVFEGITNEGTVSGTPYSAAQKADAVDAVWMINRPVGAVATDPCTVTINWGAALEGSTLAAYPTNEVGITHHNGAIFEPAIGMGNNTTNTATATFASFSPFSIAHLAAVVPVNFISVNAAYNSGRVNVSWKMANDETMQSYVIEKANDRLAFTAEKSMPSTHQTGVAQYDFLDASPFNGNNFYRIKGIGSNGEIKYSSIAKINVNDKTAFSVLQNPVQNKAMQINMSGMAAGKYNLSIVNTAAQIVYTTDLQYNGGIISNTVNLPNGISKGLFRVILRNGTDVRSVNVIVE